MFKQAPNKFILLLSGIIAMAFVLRVVDYGLDPNIDKDSIDYIQMADNISDGRINDAFLYNPRIPPLYAFLMAMGKSLGMSAEKAGVLISLVTGTLLILPAYAIAKRISDERVALIAALFVATHPYMIRISTEVMRDSLFLTLILSALAFGVMSAGKPFSRLWYLSGVFAGLASMTRDEGVEIFLAFIIWSAFEIFRSRGRVKKLGTLKRLSVSIICLMAGYLLVTAPVVVALKETPSKWNVIDPRILGTGNESFWAYLTTPSGNNK